MVRRCSAYPSRRAPAAVTVESNPPLARTTARGEDCLFMIRGAGCRAPEGRNSLELVALFFAFDFHQQFCTRKALHPQFREEDCLEAFLADLIPPLGTNPVSPF